MRLSGLTASTPNPATEHFAGHSPVEHGEGAPRGIFFPVLHKAVNYFQAPDWGVFPSGLPSHVPTPGAPSSAGAEVFTDEGEGGGGLPRVQ